MILKTIKAGVVADCIRGNSLFLIYVTDATKKITAITENDNKSHTLNSKWLSNFIDCSKLLEKETTEKKRYLTTIHELRENLKSEIDIDYLWEFVIEESEGGKTFTAEELAITYFGEEIDGNHVSAIYRLIAEDSFKFSVEDGIYIANNKERMEEIKQEIEKKKAKERRVEDFANLLKDGKPIDDSFADLSRVLLEHFYNMAEKPSKIIKKIFSYLKVNLNQPVAVYNLLVKTGIIHKYHNFHIKRIGISEKFSEKIINESEVFYNSFDESKIIEGDFKDLTHLKSVTIDDETTISYDDAFFVEKLENEKWNLYIHISNPASFLEKSSPLYMEALKRGSSVFFPEKSIEMFPEILANDFFSLMENKKRRAFTIKFKIDNNILEAYEISESIVKVAENLSYNGVDHGKYGELGEENYSRIENFTNVLRKNREEKNAVTFQRREVIINLMSEDISLELQERSKSRVLIEELMILTNSTIANFFVENSIPAIFRGQDPPKVLEGEEDFDIDSIDNIIAKNFQSMIRMNPSITGVKPIPHFSLGVKNYIQSTSPIRRFTDILHNYQLIAFLRNEKILLDSEIEEEHFKTIGGIKDASISEKFRRKFLILIHAKENINEIYDGIVVGKKRRPQVMVEKFNFTTECVNLTNDDANIGDEFKVKCTNIDFLGGFMKFEKVG